MNRSLLLHEKLDTRLSHTAGKFYGHILHFSISPLQALKQPGRRLWAYDWRTVQYVHLPSGDSSEWQVGAVEDRDDSWLELYVNEEPLLLRPVVPMRPCKVHVSDVAFPCPLCLWGTAGKWGNIGGVPPERAIAQNREWISMWNPWNWRFPSQQQCPEKVCCCLLLSIAKVIECLATDCKFWGGAR